jgi:hypothetical protein
MNDDEQGRPLNSHRRRPWDQVAMWSPVIAGVAFYGFRAWQPWGGPPCYVPVWAALTWIPFIGFPPLLTWFRARRAGYDWVSAVGLAAASLLITAIVCFFAFLVFFGQHHCGD